MKRLNLTLSLLLDDLKTMSDEGRDVPVRWIIMHMYSTAQLAKLLALRRGLDPEIAGLAAALHDISIMKTGKQEEHARASARYIYDFVERVNSGPWTDVPKISREEAQVLVNAIVKHSEKDVDSGDPFVELLKDADCCDRYLHGVDDPRRAYRERSRRVLAELGISAL